MKQFFLPIINNNYEEFNKKKDELIPVINKNDSTLTKKDIGVQTDHNNFCPKLENKLSNENYLKKKRYNNKPTGRKKKSDNSIGKHNKYSKDNIIYKIKTRTFNLILDILNQLLIQQNSQTFFKRIEGKILKNGAKIFNLNLLNSKLLTILNSSISKKYSKIKENANKELIEKYSNVPLIKEILNSTFNNVIKNIYMLSNEDFKTKYSFESKYLFNNNFYDDETEKKIMKDLIDYGLMKYFERLKERKYQIIF
jgi:hypothetical protein